MSDTKTSPAGRGVPVEINDPRTFRFVACKEHGIVGHLRCGAPGYVPWYVEGDPDAAAPTGYVRLEGYSEFSIRFYVLDPDIVEVIRGLIELRGGLVLTA